MAIKFGMKLPEIFAQLVRGYRKVTGRDPEGLDLIKIRQESMRRFEDMNKVVDMQGRSIDTSKGIMGGVEVGQKGMFDNIFARMQSQMGKNVKEVKTKNKTMLDDAIDNASPGFANDIKYDAQLVADDLAEKKFNKDFYDLDQKQQMDLYDEAYTGLSKQRFKGMKKPDPEEKASGGRIGFQGGGKDASKDDFGGGFNTGQGGGAQFSGSGGDISPGTDLGGGFRGGGGDGGGPPGNKDNNPIKDIAKKVAINQISKKLGFAKFANPIGQLMAIKGLYDSIKNPMGTPSQFSFGDDDEDESKKEKGPESISLGTGLAEQAKQAVMDRQSQIEEAAKALGYADGGRIGFKDGMDRRSFLKIMGGLAAIPVVGKFFKLAKTAKGIKSVPIIQTPNAPGKPEWFDALVTRVIREGDDVTKTMATKDRQNVYRKKIDDETEVMVTQDLDEGVTRVDIDDSVRNVTGFDDPPTVSLQVTDEIVEEGGVRIKPKFEATENDYRNYATDPDGGYETEFVENTVENTKDLTSDLTKVKSFATKKKPTMKEIVESKKRKENVKYAQEQPSSYAADRGPQYDPTDYIDDMADDFASGGIARMLGE